MENLQSQRGAVIMPRSGCEARCRVAADGGVTHRVTPLVSVARCEGGLEATVRGGLGSGDSVGCRLIYKSKASFAAEGAYDAGMQEHEAEISRKVPLAFAAPPTLHSPHGVMAGWLLEPAGALVQFAEPAKGTLEQAEWLVDVGFHVLDAYYPRRNDLLFVFDLSNMVGRSAAARSVLLNGAKALHRRFSHVIVVPPRDYPPMYLQAFQASIALVRLLGLRVSIAGSSAEVIARYGLRPCLR